MGAFLSFSIDYTGIVTPAQNVSILNTDYQFLVNCSFNGYPRPEVTLDDQSGTLGYVVQDRGEFEREMMVSWGTNDVEERKRLRGIPVSCVGNNTSGDVIRSTFTVDVMCKSC